MKHDTLPAPGRLPHPQDTAHVDAGRAAGSRRGAAHGRPGELKALATDLLRQLGAARALLLASLIDEVVDEAEERGT